MPLRRTLGLAGGFVLVAGAGSLGLLGSVGSWLGPFASVAIGWTVWRHRWPTALPRRLRSFEEPEGPDERAVAVEFRHDGVLLGWDAGILWFEKGGVGFVGRTVSFVVPRAIMHAVPAPPAWQTTLRAPQMTAKVFETVVGVVPLAPEFNAQMTLARIDALPGANVSETILPPSSMHPELIQRGLAVRRRLPLLAALVAGNFTLMLASFVLRTDASRAGMAVGWAVAFVLVLVGTPLPRTIADRLPKASRRRSS